MFVVYPVAAYRDLCLCRDEIKYVCSVSCGCRCGSVSNAGMSRY